MNTHKVTQIFIGNGAALPTGNAALLASAINQVGIYGNDMLSLTAGDTVATAGKSGIFIVNKLANGDIKRSMEIKGMSVTGYKGQSYVPAKRTVWSIGYHRASLASQSPTGSAITAGGSINVENSTLYKFSIVFKNDKTFYSERPETLSVSFTSSSAATQSNIADQIVSAINGSTFGSAVSGIKVVKAVKIGDGTGIYGLTGATNFGVEIWGLDINQYQNTTYKENIVYFSVHVDDSTGFESTTTCVQLQAMDLGSGTYNQIYNLENYNYQYEGVLNRKSWPIPTLAYLSSSTGVQSDTLAAFTASGTVDEDQLTFSAAASTQLPAGSTIVLDSGSTNVTYVIKYWVSTTVAVLDTVLSATVAAVTVAGKAWYDIYTIEFTDVVTSPGANVGAFAKKVVMIATPAINTTATAMTTQSTESSNIEDVLDPWMTSTPLNPTVLSL